MPTSLSGRSWSSTFRKSMSLDEMMPTNLPPILPLSVTGMPQNPWRALAWKTSLTRSLGLITTGSVMKPCSYRWRRKGRKEMRRGKNRMGKWKNKEGAKKRSGEGNIKESLPILYKLGSRQIHCSTHAHTKKTHELRKMKINMHKKDERQTEHRIATLTLRTSLAWNSGVQLWWMKPIPPVSCKKR